MDTDKYYTNVVPYAESYPGKAHEEARFVHGFLQGLNYGKAIPSRVEESIKTVISAMENFYNLNYHLNRQREHFREGQEDE